MRHFHIQLFLTGFLFLISVATELPGQDKDTVSTSAPELYPKWTFWLPGGTHFYSGRTGEGILFSGIEAGLTATGIFFNSDLSSSPYYNYPLYLGLNLYAVDKTDYARNTLEYIKQRWPDFNYDPVSFHDLLTEPFKPENILTPITGSLVALAMIELYIESVNSEFSLKSVDKIKFFRTYLPKNQSMPVYYLASLGMSWEAGIAEEYWIRNYMMPVMDYRMGKNKGLLLSSGIFGGLHAFNYLFVKNPDPLTIMYHVGFTTVMGYILGKNVQHNNYKIGKAVAAHTWYDFTLMVGSFLVNPKENVFGVDVKLRL